MLWDREAQQRSRARASVQDRGCGCSVSQSDCLLTLRDVPRCFSIEERVCRNRLSCVAFTHNLKDKIKETLSSLTKRQQSAVQLNRTKRFWVESMMRDFRLKFYLRCLLTVVATYRNSLMSGSGRHFTELWGFSSVKEEEEEVLASTTCFSFCPRLVNQSTWSRSMMALRSCWSRFLRIKSTDLWINGYYIFSCLVIYMTHPAWNYSDTLTNNKQKIPACQHTNI